MSKIGEKTITIPDGTQVLIEGQLVKVTGKLGTLEVQMGEKITAEQEGNNLYIKRQNDSKKSKASHGLYRSLISNAVSGVNTPWEKNLEIFGTGYRVKMQGANISLEVGYSHPVVYTALKGITFTVEGTNKIKVSGIDKQLVGQVAHQIKTIKKPDPYKGKGVRYEGEVIKLKAGKKAKTAGAK